MEIGETLEVESAEGFADWLRQHGGTKRDVWVIIYKKGSGKQTVTYDELVAVSLCYGWIDGQMKSIDGEKYAQRFSPRKKKSNWTPTNRALARTLISAGRMTQAGYDALPEDMKIPTLAKRGLRTED